ncbi:hypothetical protein KR222_004393 [Zaprionus bogoriensis]|nr:hypothetical protein KR222_004393 [Zaprionus bogoriensis]
MASAALTLAIEVPQRKFDKRVWESIDQSYTSLLVILTTFAGIAFARIATHRLCKRSGPTARYLLEFPLIVLPGVLFVTVAHGYSAHFVAGMALCFGCFVVLTGALQRARSRAHFELGTRPTVLTIVRALTHLITGICILAIDFQSFHRPYRKSKLFGAQLMDTGIGLFVVTMGLVSRRVRTLAELRRSVLHSAAPLVLLGVARTLAIEFVGYGQDEREYGRQLNAFFTLGFTKLLGSLLGYLLCDDAHLLPAAMAVLVAHQLALSAGGIADYVMDEDLPRSTFVAANREGLCSLPGFVSIYFIAIVVSRWLVSKPVLSYAEMVRKLWRFVLISVLCWTLTMISAQFVGISRVTCNMSYVCWMIAISVTMIGLSLYIFEFIIGSVMPLDTKLSVAESLERGAARKSAEGSEARAEVNLICESLNMNGLSFFLLANVLTGCVNMFLRPEDRSDTGSVVILLVYMFLAIFVVFQLYGKRIRIA